MDCSSAALGRYGRKKARTDTAGQWHGTFQNLDLDEVEISALFTSLILLRVLMVTSLCLPDFLGACCSFMFVYSSVMFSECLFPTLKCFSTCTLEGYKATSLSRAQLSVLVPNARSGNLRYGSSSRWRQQDVMVCANCENDLYDGRCCH